MKKLVALVVGILILGSGLVYAKNPQGEPSQASPKTYKGAGIGKEVSTQAKEIKEANATKGEFGQTVREKAKEKKRIQQHKELIKQQKSKSSNETSNVTK